MDQGLQMDPCSFDDFDDRGDIPFPHGLWADIVQFPESEPPDGGIQSSNLTENNVSFGNYSSDELLAQLELLPEVAPTQSVQQESGAANACLEKKMQHPEQPLAAISLGNSTVDLVEKDNGMSSLERMPHPKPAAKPQSQQVTQQSALRNQTSNGSSTDLLHGLSEMPADIYRFEQRLPTSTQRIPSPAKRYHQPSSCRSAQPATDLHFQNAFTQNFDQSSQFLPQCKPQVRLDSPSTNLASRGPAYSAVNSVGNPASRASHVQNHDHQNSLPPSNYHKFAPPPFVDTTVPGSNFDLSIHAAPHTTHSQQWNSFNNNMARPALRHAQVKVERSGSDSDFHRKKRVCTGNMEDDRKSSPWRSNTARDVGHDAQPGIGPPDHIQESTISVGLLFEAMVNMSEVEDNPGMLQIWRKIVATERDRIWLACEELLETMKKSHKKGGKLGKKHPINSYDTMQHRFDELCYALKTQKTMCKHLLQEHYALQVVNDPIQARKRVANNRVVNSHKAKFIEEGKKLVKGTTQRNGHSASADLKREASYEQGEYDAEGITDESFSDEELIQAPFKSPSPLKTRSWRKRVKRPSPNQDDNEYNSTMGNLPKPKKIKRQSSTNYNALDGVAPGPDYPMDNGSPQIMGNALPTPEFFYTGGLESNPIQYPMDAHLNNPSPPFAPFQAASPYPNYGFYAQPSNGDQPTPYSTDSAQFADIDTDRTGYNGSAYPSYSETYDSSYR